MKLHRNAVLGLILSMSALVGLGQARAADDSANPIKVELQVLPVKVALAGRVRLFAVIKNMHGTRSAMLRGEPGWSEGGGLVLRITGPNGQTVQAPYVESGITLDEARKGDRFVTLKPGSGFGVQRAEDVASLFSAPGEYRVSLAYQSPSPESDNDNANDIEGARAQSDDITITVLE